LVAATVALFLVLWVRAALDVFRRGDVSGSTKSARAIGMLVLPFVGVLGYTLLRPSEEHGHTSGRDQFRGHVSSNEVRRPRPPASTSRPGSGTS
jgi:hypothetical protein